MILNDIHLRSLPPARAPQLELSVAGACDPHRLYRALHSLLESRRQRSPYILRERRSHVETRDDAVNLPAPGERARRREAPGSSARDRVKALFVWIKSSHRHLENVLRRLSPD